MIEIYVDGASKGNPGISGAGIYIKNKSEVYEYSIPLGVRSNHEAEFIAVIKALEVCQDLFPEEILSFRSDSQIVVDAIEEGYTKNQAFLPLLDEIKDKANAFPIYFIKWIPSKDNKHADRLAKEAIHKQ